MLLNCFIFSNKIPAARLLREELLSQSEDVKNNAEAAKNESTNLFTEADKLIVPSVDVDTMDRRSQDVISEAEKLEPVVNDQVIKLHK